MGDHRYGTILDGLSPDRQREVARILTETYEPLVRSRGNAAKIESLLRQTLEYVGHKQEIKALVEGALVEAARQARTEELIADIAHHYIVAISGHRIMDLDKIALGQMRHAEKD